MSMPLLSDLDQYRHAKLPEGFQQHVRSLFSPVDNVHDALLLLIQSAEHSLVGSMYGYDDDDFDAAIRAKVTDPNIIVQFNLDKSQAGGAHEKLILAKWTGQPRTRIAIGHSSKGAISHLKALVIDGLDVITGSTNWSTSGETLQDNHLVVIRDATLAAEVRSRLDAIHLDMLDQMSRTVAS